MRRPSRLCPYVACFLWLAAACSSCGGAENGKGQLVVSGEEKVQEHSLATAIVGYYQAESKRDWSTTYKARPPAYRKLVPFSTYSEGMDKGMLDWNLKKIDILDSARLKNSDVAVRIRFHEEYGPKAAEVYFPGVATHGMASTVETTLWRRIDNVWFCVDAGDRRHVPFDGRMVFD